MLATFCLRLACGLAASLLLLTSTPINPRFFRSHFLIILGLTAAGALLLGETAGRLLWASLFAAMAAAFLGSLAWSLEGAPGGKLLIGITPVALVLVLGLSSLQPAPSPPVPGTGESETQPPGFATWSFARLWADELTSAALLGTATTAMLVGHSYLISPTMSLTPLMRLFQAFFAATLLRVVVAGVGLWSWTAGHSLGNLEGETILWLPLRWGLGFAGPLVLAWMAREAAKIRSTQSATGILYVVVIFCFLGELTSLLLLRDTGSVM